MAGGRHSRSDRTLRAAVGIGVAGTAAGLCYAAWSSHPKDPEHLFVNGAFDAGILVVVIGLVLLVAATPWWNRPRFRIECGNGRPFDRAARPQDRDVRVVLASAPQDVEVYLKIVRVHETRGRWAENVTVEVLGVSPEAVDPPPFLPWWGADTRERESFRPGGHKDAILHGLYVNTKDPDRNMIQALGEQDPYKALLAVSCEGKRLAGAEVEVSDFAGKNHPTITARPLSARETHRAVKKWSRDEP